MENEPEALVKFNPDSSQNTSGDLLVKSRLYNAVLYDAIKRSGLTQEEYSKPLGINPSTLSALAGLRLSPWHFRTGERKDFAEALANHIEIAFNELFPKTLYSLRVLVPPEALERRYDSIQLVPLLEARNVRMLETPSTIYEQKEIDELLETALSSLTPREEQVIKMRYGLEGKEHHLDEIGAYYSLSRERIRQIEGKALRKLRHPDRSKALQDFLAIERGGKLKPLPAKQESYAS